MVELYKKDILIVFQIVANMLRMFGTIFIIPAIVSLFTKDYYFAWIFFLIALVTTVLFSFIKKFFKYQECKMKHAIISLALVWIIVPIISSIPFLLNHMSFVDSLFESISGWSTTGLTMIEDPALIPMALNFYRGFIQWAGGFGAVVLVLLLYERPSTAQVLFLAEGRFEDFFVDFSKISRLIVFMYSVYTAIGILAFTLVGVPFFDAVVNTMALIATGGYSSNAIGIGLYGKVPMFIAIVFMYIGATSFLAHYKVFKGKFRKLIENPEVKFMFLVSAIATLAVWIDIYTARKHTYYDGLFYVVSTLTTTGAGTKVTIDTFPTASLFIFVLLMICGGTYGSTAGGLKIWRVIIILKNIKREIMKPFYPSGTIKHIKMGNNVISDEDSLKVSVYAFLYLVILAIGILIFVFAGYTLINSIFVVASAQGNVGQNIITTNYYNMSPFLKYLLIFHMYFGRVEILPFIALLRSLLMVRK